MTRALGYAALDPTAPLTPYPFERRPLRDNDVSLRIRYCGVCDSDLHSCRNDWGNARYPLIPGHEIVGEVTAVGAAVTRHRVGDRVAVGCLVDSCMACPSCEISHEHQCEAGSTGTYNGKDPVTGELTLGGYSDHIVVREEFVLKVPDRLDLARAAPILCAGITTWSPLRRFKVGPGSRIAVVGLGGLGHMGVKLAVGLGADVTVITTSAGKTVDALALGASAVLLSTDRDAMRAANRRFDFILDTVPVQHDVAPYVRLLRPEGALVMVGAIDALPSFHSGLLLGGNKVLAGSAIGGIAETQELLDFCAAHDIHPDCEMIAMQDINHAWARMERADVKYRFVIDMASLEKDRP